MFSAIFATFFALRAAPVQKHQKFCPNLAGLPDDLLRSIFAVLFPLPSCPFSYPFSYLFFMPFLFHILHSYGAFRFGASFNRHFSCAACSTQKGMKKCRIAFSMPLSLICPYIPSYLPYTPYFFLSLPSFSSFSSFSSSLSYIFLPFYICLFSASDPSAYKFLYSSEFLIKEALNDCFRASAVYTLIHCAYKYSFI